MQNSKFKIQNLKFNAGFTLIEIMVSVTIFSVVMLISMGAILAVLDSNRKSQAIRSVMDNLNYTLDDMTRAIRFGTNYHCDATVGDITTPRDCQPLGSSSDSMSVLSSDLRQMTFKLVTVNGIGRIIKIVDGTTYYLTSPDTSITRLAFRVYGSYPFSGAGTTDQLQPEVIVVVSGYAGTKANIKSSFSLETTLSQRKFDF